MNGLSGWACHPMAECVTANHETSPTRQRGSKRLLRWRVGLVVLCQIRITPNHTAAADYLRRRETALPSAKAIIAIAAEAGSGMIGVVEVVITSASASFF